MENKKKILDYQEFYDELIDRDYLPAKIDYQWTDNNEDFMRETLFVFYMAYSKLNNPDLLQSFLKLYSDVILNAYIHYPGEGEYF